MEEQRFNAVHEFLAKGEQTTEGKRHAHNTAIGVMRAKAISNIDMVGLKETQDPNLVWGGRSWQERDKELPKDLKKIEGKLDDQQDTLIKKHRALENAKQGLLFPMY